MRVIQAGISGLNYLISTLATSRKMGMSSVLHKLTRSNFSNLSRKNFNFEFRAGTENDRGEIMELLRKWFFPHIVYSKLIFEDNRICEEFERYSVKPLLDNPSWNIVVTNDNKIIGVALNSEINRETYFNPAVPNAKSTKLATLNLFMGHVRKETDLYGKFPDIDKVFIMQRGCVDPEFRRRNVAEKGALKALDLAKELGYKLIMGESASVYSAQIYRQLGFQSIYIIKFEDFKINNQRIFKANPPHDRTEVFVKRI